MIASLRGTILERGAEAVVIEVASVGYTVSMSPSAIAQLPPSGEEVLLFVAESVAMYGGGVSLYGFTRAEERQIFNALRDHVPGTGAKKALEFLDKASRSLPDFRRAVIDKDVRGLVAVFGFTAKTAEKIVSGLDGKLDAVSVARVPAGAAAGGSAFEETVAGLLTLGYKEQAARQAAQSARSALGAEAASQALIREALRFLSGRA
jgi:Holliday junction DNA helicase RuvA